MRQATAALKEILAGGGGDHEETFDLFYDGARRLENVPIVADSLRLTETASASIQQSGSLTVFWSDDYGRSLSPRTMSDDLAPFGAQIYLYTTVTAAPLFREKVLMGVYEITNVPSAIDEQSLFQGQRIVLNSEVELEFKELLNGVSQDRFDTPYAPSDLSSVWAEYQLISGLPVVRTIDDTPITRSVVYEESRIDAVYDLADVLGGIPHMQQQGALAMRPKEWPDPIDRIKRGDGGTLVHIDGELSADEIYNRVAVRARSDDTTAILGTAEVETGPLRAKNPDGSISPFRRRTRFYSSEYITTESQGSAYASQQLPEVSRLALTANVTEMWNPLRERGDVIEIERDDQILVGRIESIDRDGGATMQMKVALRS